MTAARGTPDGHGPPRSTPGSTPGSPAGSPPARLAATRLYLIATFPTGDAIPADPSSPAAEAAAVAAAGAAWNPDNLPLESVRWTWRVADAVRGGVGAVQVRVKAERATPLRRELLRRLRAALPPHVLLLVNDDVEAVLDERGAPLADGVHLGREDATAAGGLARVRLRLGPALLLGTSTRTLREVTAARTAGADHVGFGAMAPTATKSDTVLADPAELQRALRRHADFPLFPIGGLGPETLAVVSAAGCRRAAIGSAILGAPDPAAAARACLKALGR